MNRPARIALSLLASLALPTTGTAQEEGELARQAFVQAFGAAPADSGSTVGAARSAAAVAAIEAGRSAVSSLDDLRLRAAFTDRLGALVDSQEDGNILETLWVILKESVSEMSEEKKYWLNRLSVQNMMNEHLSQYMKELAHAGQELGEMEGAGRVSTRRASTAATVPVTVRTFDPVWLDTLGEPPTGRLATVCDPCLATRETTLNAEQIQREQESILGLQRRLQTAREETQTRHAELERRSAAVVGMLAEALKSVDQERDGAIGKALRTTS